MCNQTITWFDERNVASNGELRSLVRFVKSRRSMRRVFDPRSQYVAEDSIKRWKRRKIQRGLSKTLLSISFSLSLSLSLSLFRSRISPMQLCKRSLTPKAFKRIKFSRIVYDKMFPFNLSNHRRALQTFANLTGGRD